MDDNFDTPYNVNFRISPAKDLLLKYSGALRQGEKTGERLLAILESEENFSEDEFSEAVNTMMSPYVIARFIEYLFFLQSIRIKIEENEISGFTLHWKRRSFKCEIHTDLGAFDIRQLELLLKNEDILLIYLDLKSLQSILIPLLERGIEEINREKNTPDEYLRRTFNKAKSYDPSSFGNLEVTFVNGIDPGDASLQLINLFDEKTTQAKAKLARRVKSER